MPPFSFLVRRIGAAAVTALLQTLVRGSAEPSLGPIYIDVSFPRPSSSPCLGILVHWLPIDSVLLTEPSQLLGIY